MEKTDIDKLRELPIEGVAERLGLKVSKHKAICPFHEDSHPSLTFNVAKHTFRCYVCGAHGGVIDLALKLIPGNPSFVDACKWLAEDSNIILSYSDGDSHSKQPSQSLSQSHKFDPQKYLRFFEHPFLNDAAVDFLYNKRHLDPRVVNWCKLNSFKDWLQIPYYNIDSNLIGVQWRYLGTDKSQPRFKFPYGSTCHIYNMPVLRMLKKDEPLYITEGASDCWSMLSSGHKAIAIPSATLLNKKDLLALSSSLSLNWHMYPDADVPGEKLYIQLVQLANQLGACLTRHSLPHGCKDFSDFYVSQKSINHKP